MKSPDSRRQIASMWRAIPVLIASIASGCALVSETAYWPEPSDGSADGAAMADGHLGGDGASDVKDALGDVALSADVFDGSTGADGMEPDAADAADATADVPRADSGVDAISVADVNPWDVTTDDTGSRVDGVAGAEAGVDGRGSLDAMMIDIGTADVATRDARPLNDGISVADVCVRSGVDTDPLNCGACGHVCASGAFSAATCSAGTCGLVCSALHSDCDRDPTNGCEVDVTTATDCGACGVTCSAGGSCALVGSAYTCLGGVGEPCDPSASGTPCGGSTACVGSVCACGALGEPCCGGTLCATGGTCDSGGYCVTNALFSTGPGTPCPVVGSCGPGLVCESTLHILVLNLGGHCVYAAGH